MCILCVASRWSRRIVTMLPWLIIPLIILWALSQLLPPGFRFEVTSPRLACVGVLLFSLGWYEILMPRLSEWRTRRSLMLHEKRKIEAQEAAKWRKEAIRRCRNCLTAYKDQKPVGGKFMCTYCGHVSKRPALDVPGGPTGASSAGIGQFMGRKDLRMQGNLSWTQRMFENELWPGIWGVGSNGEHCIIGGHNSAGVLIVFRLVSFVAYCIWWACSKMWRGGMSDGERLRAERKGGQRKGEDGGCHESKVEKLRRKAEEKRLARLEKEQMEAEERMQREEVARLVDERRKQRVEMMGADKDNGMEISAEVEKEVRREQEMERRRQEKANEKGKDAGGGKSRNAYQDDPKRSKDKGKKDKRPEECTKGLKTAGVEIGTKSDELSKTGVNPGKGYSLKTTCVVKPGAYPLPKYQVKGRAPAFVTSKKQEKPSSNSVAGTTSINKGSSNEGVVNKPSAWNRISWAWGKGNVVRESADKEQVNIEKDVEHSLETSSTQEIPVSSPSMVTEPQEEPTTVQTPSYFGSFDDAAPVFTSLPEPVSSPLVMEQLPAFSASSVTASKLPPMPSSFSSPDYENASSCLPSVNTSGVSSPFQGSSVDSCSVYSTFLPPPAVTSDAPAFDRWGTDLLPKSTWQMWDAPNLELPRLTQSLANDVRPLPPASSQPSSLLSSSGLPSAVGSIPSVPISNNLWSNYHAFESTRRIWEDLDLQSEVTPPEFIDCITQEIMKDPVIAADGHSYERSAIEEWLRTHNTSPKTGEVLPALACSASGVDKSLRCNHNLRGQIIEYRECMERGSDSGECPRGVSLTAAATNSWQTTTTEGLRNGHIGGLYTPPGVGSVWAFNTA